MAEVSGESLDSLLTEQSDPRYAGLERLDTLAAVHLMNFADADVPAAVSRALPAVADAIDAIVERLRHGGRLRYVGAGTAGRLAVLDASEIPPTFGADPDVVRAVLAGAPDALLGATEGVEDSAADGAADLHAAGFTPADCMVGVTASGRTPYVLGAVDAATSIGALTVGISGNPGAELSRKVDIPIEVPVGPEVLAGSTRLRAGTAQKLVLNMISTLAMVRLGHTYRGHMVDLRATNDKLVRRATRIVAEITGTDLGTARHALDAADRHVKTAVLMLKLALDAPAARRLLAAHDGKLDAALS